MEAALSIECVGNMGISASKGCAGSCVVAVGMPHGDNHSLLAEPRGDLLGIGKLWSHCHLADPPLTRCQYRLGLFHRGHAQPIRIESSLLLFVNKWPFQMNA
jgi:hypothetical protein